jgi:hypothetical protein
MDPGDRRLLEEAVRAALARAGASGADAALAELGWLELLEAEPRDAIEIVFTALGAANATATVLDDVLATGLGVEPRADRAVALPLYARWDPPGRVAGGTARAQGLVSARIAAATDVVVVCRDAGALVCVIVPAGAVDARPVHGIDRAAGMHTCTVEAAAGGSPLDEVRWETALALGRRAIGHEVAGACRAMLGLARTHALEREQFGRPIGRFQAVRHRLADALVALDALEATLAAAGDAPDPRTAALAKATAGRAAATVAAHCQQVLAGIGFTTEHPFHRFLTRTIALDGLLGSPDEIAADLGRHLLATRRVPTLIEL